MSNFESFVPESTCRLSVLNFDCLGLIFNHLSTIDLINLCGIDPIVCNAVKERGLNDRMINVADWNRIWSTETIFEELGERIRHLTITESSVTSIDHFLQLLTTHCTVNRIRSLSMTFDACKINAQLLEAARPYFKNVQALHFASCSHQESADQLRLLMTIIDSSTQLKTIQLECIWIDGNVLRINDLMNVENLAIINSGVAVNQQWDANLAKQSKLKIFTWFHVVEPNYTLCENIARNCTQLESFVNAQPNVAPKYFQYDFVMNRYNYFSLFENLKSARITSYMRSGRDLIDGMAKMAEKNTLESLSIMFANNASDGFDINNTQNTRYQFAEFSSLKSLEVINHSSCQFWDRTLMTLVRAAVNLNEVIISGSSDPMNAVHIVSLVLKVKQLTSFNICNVQTVGLSRAFDRIRKEAENRNTILTVFVNSQQRAELQGHQPSNAIRIVEVGNHHLQGF